VFANKAYQAFAARVTAASEAAKEPDDLQIKKVLPILYDRMRMMQADLRQSHAALQQSVSDLQREIRVLSANVKTALRDSSSSRRSLRRRRRRSRRQRPSSTGSPRPVLTVGGSTSAGGRI
jgi:DNA anti-recombination protein RmuC